MLYLWCSSREVMERSFANGKDTRCFCKNKKNVRLGVWWIQNNDEGVDFVKKLNWNSTCANFVRQYGKRRATRRERWNRRGFGSESEENLPRSSFAGAKPTLVTPIPGTFRIPSRISLPTLHDLICRTQFLILTIRTNFCVRIFTRQKNYMTENADINGLCCQLHQYHRKVLILH